MIPKTIHYCWFGGNKKSKLILNCINSWREYCVDYEILEWNESNTNLDHPFVKACVKLKKWAFVADYIRLKVLFEQGGVYLDTDMMLVKSLNFTLVHECFFGAEEPNYLSAGVIGAKKGNLFIKSCLYLYNSIKINLNTDFTKIAMPILITNKIEDFSEQPLNVLSVVNIKGVVVYPQNYFYPFPNREKCNINNYLDYRKTETIAIHLWNASWVSYNEFDYLKKKMYFKAFKKVIYTILFSRQFNLYYFKRLYNHLIR